MCSMFRGSMMATMFHLLAQMDPSKLEGSGAPRLEASASYGLTWVLAVILTAGILLITFKISKRNSLDRQ